MRRLLKFARGRYISIWPEYFFKSSAPLIIGLKSHAINNLSFEVEYVSIQSMLRLMYTFPSKFKLLIQTIYLLCDTSYKIHYYK